MSNLRLIKKKKKKKKKKIEWDEPEGDGGQMAQETLLEVVDNQIRENDPPETKTTLQRLIKEGYSENDAKKLIAGVVVKVIDGMLKEKETYNQEQYIKALKSLPDSAFE